MFCSYSWNPVRCFAMFCDSGLFVRKKRLLHSHALFVCPSAASAGWKAGLFSVTFFLRSAVPRQYASICADLDALAIVENKGTYLGIRNRVWCEFLPTRNYSAQSGNLLLPRTWPLHAPLSSSTLPSRSTIANFGPFLFLWNVLIIYLQAQRNSETCKSTRNSSPRLLSKSSLFY